MALTHRGFINVDIQMRTNVPHIFAIGDIVGQPMLAHKAGHEAHVAADTIVCKLKGNKELVAATFNARVIFSVTYTDPEMAWAGVIKLLFDDSPEAHGYGKILGGSMFGTHAGDMSSEIALLSNKPVS